MMSNRCATRHPASRRGTVAIGSGAVLLAGCSFGGLNSLDMPGTAGHGSRVRTPITVELPDVATLPQNSPVMVDDVTVGSVSGIEAVQRPDGTFYAAVKLSLDGNVDLPENATAKVAQTSLLGSQHIELAPPVDEAGQGKLSEGSQHPARPHRPLPDHRGSAVVARRRGEQGQSRCAAGHHRRGLRRGRGPDRAVRRPDARGWPS